MSMTTLDEFLARDPNAWGTRNAWVKFQHGQIYMRHAERKFDGDITTNLDLANIFFDPPGKGGLTALLDRLEPRYGIYVENVLNPRLHEYLKRRGYEQIGQKYPYCMVKDVVGQCC